MVAYYRGVAPALLPHVARRALTLWRFPHGVAERGWWQNECRGAPEWMTVAELRGQRFCVVDDEAALAWVANQGAIELHPLGATIDAPETPSAVVFDLDPAPPATLVECCVVALDLRERLGLDAFAKTSGASGLHVVVPLAPGHSFDRTKAFARAAAEALAAERPELVTAAQRRAARAGKVLVDWLQNDATRTTAAPYSLRAQPLPYASTPLAWEEVESVACSRSAASLRFTADDVLRRLDRLGDLWAPVRESRQTLPENPLSPGAG